MEIKLRRTWICIPTRQLCLESEKASEFLRVYPYYHNQIVEYVYSFFVNRVS
ncbi:hypothetical protein X777_11918 [Ooceraea biroi]|uniref:Uncharacterized protein n=1 Tax=Ooceraea biroi TaxID=2015173 RepID=A0A026W0E9_OOCBI|nr:hypothetical protein X777_11918 [Ooceraea biroi]